MASKRIWLAAYSMAGGVVWRRRGGVSYVAGGVSTNAIARNNILSLRYQLSIIASAS